MNDMDNNNHSEMDDSLKNLAERDILTSGLRTLSGLFIGLALSICVHAVYSSFMMFTDKSVPLVVCPRSTDLDAPILMKTINQTGIESQDRWIRGFMRRFLLKQFPRNEKDVVPFFDYIVKHSRGNVKSKFVGLQKDITEVTDLIKNGYYYKFYPKSSNDLRIRPAEGSSKKWIVEIDGYLVKRLSITQERYTPTLRYTVEAGEVTFENPEGLYVIEGTVEQITDYVSGRKESL